MHLPPASAAVIVHDPSDELPEGFVVRDREVERARADGVVALDTSSVALSTPGGGYARRAFGYGEVLDSFSTGPVMLCPVLLRVAPGTNVLHWAAHLRRVRGLVPNGRLQLGLCALDSGRPPSMTTISHVQLDQLDAESDGWIVQGRAAVDSDVAMTLPFALSGVGKGVAIRWLAIGHRILG